MPEEEDERIVDRRAASRMRDDDEAKAETPAKEEETVIKEETNDAASETEDIEALKERAEQNYKNWQRSAADFINYKRRVEEERSELARITNAASATMPSTVPIAEADKPTAWPYTGM